MPLVAGVTVVLHIETSGPCHRTVLWHNDNLGEKDNVADAGVRPSPSRMSLGTRNALRIWGNALWFNALWFAAVIGSTHGLLWPALVCMAGLLAWTVVCGGDWRADCRMAVAGMLVALTVEPVWINAGALTYPDVGALGLPPTWIVVLWAGFAVSFNHCLAWLRGRMLLAAVLGSAGSLSSISAGLSLEAVVMPEGWLQAALFYAPVWAFLTPALAWLSERFAPGTAD